MSAPERISTGSEPALSIDTLRRVTEPARSRDVQREYEGKHLEQPESKVRCQFDGSVMNAERKAYMFPVPPGRCRDEATWEVQLDYYDHNSPFTRLCTRHFMQLPPQPVGGLYRIRRIK